LRADARKLCGLAFVAGGAILLATSGCDSAFEFDIPPAGGGNAGSSGAPAGSAGTPTTAGGGATAVAGSSAASGGAQAGSAGSGGAGGERADETCGSYARCPPDLYCSDGECRECASDGDCMSTGSSRCDPERHRCVACLTEQDCGPGFACDSLANRCLLKCGDGLACPRDLHGCDEGRGVCYECDEDYECDDSPTGELCASDGSGCVQCRSDQDCDDQHCDPLSGRCVMCRDGRDCDTGLCDPSAHVCLDD
jgi:hypothetical protein